jgi:hypothetical protein
MQVNAAPCTPAAPQVATLLSCHAMCVTSVYQVLQLHLTDTLAHCIAAMTAGASAS